MRQLGIRYLAHGSFLTVERRHYLGDGGAHVVRDVVRHPGAVVVVPLLGDEVVLIRQYRVAVGRHLLELPAGKVDAGNESPAETARRECKEEIGFRPRSLVLLQEFFSSPGFSDERMWLYLAEDLEEVEQQPQGVEERAAEIVRMKLTEAVAAADRGEIEDAKSLLGLYAVERRRKHTS
jgi:ADP-ribose pyrophosphatase